MRIPRRLPSYPYGDNEPIYFGDGSDVSMYCDGTNFIIDSNATGDITIDSTGGFYISAGGYKAFKFTANAVYAMFRGTEDAADALELFANQAQDYGRICIGGGAAGHLDIFTTAGGRIYLYKAAQIMAYFDHDGTTTTYLTAAAGLIIYAGGGNIQMENHIILAPDVNRDVRLLPTGTGLVMFGTSVGTGDVVCNGYVTIRDNAGAACKLMRCA